MDEPRWRAGKRVARASRVNWRRDLGALSALVLVSTAIHAWHICHTEVTARDGVGFIRYAWQLRHEPWIQVLRRNPHPPLYPMLVLAVWEPVRQFAHGDEAMVMQVSAQAASALAGVLLVVPMFYLGKQLFDRRVGFWAALLFQCLPASSRVLSDALAEGLWLLLAATAVLLAVWAFRTHSKFGFALCGACSGLAYLARPEGALIAGAIGLVLLGTPLVPAWRRPWADTLYSGAALGLTALAVAGPYAVVIGHITNKTTGIEILGTAERGVAGGGDSLLLSCKPPPQLSPIRGEGAVRHPEALASALAVFWFDAKKSEQWRRLLWSLKAVGGEFIKGFGYFAWLPALLALYCRRQPFRRDPVAWVIFTLCALDTLVLWRVAYVAGYVAERHSLPIVMCGLFWTVAGVVVISDRLLVAGSWLAKFEIRNSKFEIGNICSSFLVVLLAGVALPKCLEPLHANRAGFHAAGLWLADHAGPDDLIVDPFAWAELYSGHALRSSASAQSGSHAVRQYVVMGGSSNEHARLPLMPTAESLASRGSVVYRWNADHPSSKAEEVLVYCVPVDRHP
jgi:hypothetical protein